ncbi:MAG: hypothetical protein JW772_00730 [Candidatus Diapherotrites archaeon]|nr:hypothetical protein [Candidatus Diapherotrites archaeon]
MRVQLEDMIYEIKFRLENNKDGLRSKVLLKDALKALEDYKKILDKKSD